MFCEGNGQIFTSSGGTCPEKTCENSGEVICSAVSRPGCDCPEDMVRKYTQKMTSQKYWCNTKLNV